MPYCKTCHVKNFGTRDLRQANLPRREEGPTYSPPTTPPKFTEATSTSPVGGKAPSSPLRPTRSSGPSPTPASPPKRIFPNPDTVYNSALDSRYDRPAPIAEEGGDEGVTSANARPVPSSPTRFTPNVSGRETDYAAESQRTWRQPQLEALTYGNNRPLVPMSTGPSGTRYGTALGGTVGVNMTGSSPNRWGASTPSCPRCGKNVYFAEQVKAVGKTYHKGCLRCMECNTSLDSNRLRDHNDQPFCVRCYSKLHGPQGSGYALLGKAGG